MGFFPKFSPSGATLDYEVEVPDLENQLSALKPRPTATSWKKTPVIVIPVTIVCLILSSFILYAGVEYLMSGPEHQMGHANLPPEPQAGDVMVSDTQTTPPTTANTPPYHNTIPTGPQPPKDDSDSQSNSQIPTSFNENPQATELMNAKQEHANLPAKPQENLDQSVVSALEQSSENISGESESEQHANPENPKIDDASMSLKSQATPKKPVGPIIQKSSNYLRDEPDHSSDSKQTDSEETSNADHITPNPVPKSEGNPPNPDT
eukprot:186976_1